MTKDSPSLITIYEPLIICMRGKFFPKNNLPCSHCAPVKPEGHKHRYFFSVNPDWQVPLFWQRGVSQALFNRTKSGLNCKRRSYVKPSWQNVNYNLQDNDDDDKTMVIITILVIIIINRKLKQRRRQRKGKPNWLKAVRTYLFVRWLCFWIGFFGRNDLTDFYDFWHP